MEIASAPARKSSSDTHQSQWLQDALSGVDEKLEAILNLLEDRHFPLQSSDIQGTRKEAVIETVQDLCKSYRSLAEKYNKLKSVSIDALCSGSSSLSNNKSTQLNCGRCNEVSGGSDDSQLEAIDSNPESTVEDGDIDYEGITNDLQYQKTFDHNFKSEIAWSERENSKMSELVEEYTQLQVELIKRNAEKSETIRKLQSEVSRLMTENKALQHSLSFSDYNKQPVEVSSPRRKTISRNKLFRCCR